MSPDRKFYDVTNKIYSDCLRWHEYELKGEDRFLSIDMDIPQYLVLLHMNDEKTKQEFYGILTPSLNIYNSGVIHVPLDIRGLEGGEFVKDDRHAYYLSLMVNSNSKRVKSFIFNEEKLTGNFQITHSQVGAIRSQMYINSLDFVLNGESELFENQPIFGWQKIDTINHIPRNETLAEGIAQEFITIFPNSDIRPIEIPAWMKMNDPV